MGPFSFCFNDTFIIFFINSKFYSNFICYCITIFLYFILLYSFNYCCCLIWNNIYLNP